MAAPTIGDRFEAKAVTGDERDDDRRRLIGVDARQRRQVAGVVVLHAERLAELGLGPDQAVAVAQARRVA